MSEAYIITNIEETDKLNTEPAECAEKSYDFTSIINGTFYGDVCYKNTLGNYIYDRGAYIGAPFVAFASAGAVLAHKAYHATESYSYDMVTYGNGYGLAISNTVNTLITHIANIENKEVTVISAGIVIYQYYWMKKKDYEIEQLRASQRDLNARLTSVEGAGELQIAQTNKIVDLEKNQEELGEKVLALKDSNVAREDAERKLTKSVGRLTEQFDSFEVNQEKLSGKISDFERTSEGFEKLELALTEDITSLAGRFDDFKISVAENVKELVMSDLETKQGQSQVEVLELRRDLVQKFTTINTELSEQHSSIQRDIQALREKILQTEQFHSSITELKEKQDQLECTLIGLRGGLEGVNVESSGQYLDFEVETQEQQGISSVASSLYTNLEEPTLANSGVVIEELGVNQGINTDQGL